METIRAIARVFSCLIFLASLFCSGVAAQQRQIVVGLTTRTGSNSLPFVISEEKGFFKAEGLNAVVVVMQNQVVVNGVVTKNVDDGDTVIGNPARVLQRPSYPHDQHDRMTGDGTILA